MGPEAESELMLASQRRTASGRLKGADGDLTLETSEDHTVVGDGLSPIKSPTGESAAEEDDEEEEEMTIERSKTAPPKVSFMSASALLKR